MAFLFLPWKNMSAAFAGVAGAPVAVVPWGNHFALFGTDAGGVVSCAGCYPQSGLMGPWAPISDAFTGVPGGPVTVLPWGDQFALFATDASGVVSCAGGDPQNGLMGPWAPISDAFTGIPGGPVTVLPWGDQFALFATDASGVVSCAGGDPQNGLMGPWAPISNAFTGIPGGPVTVLPWGDQFALFGTDATGTVSCAGGDPQNGLMGPWAPVSGGFSGPPGAAVGAVPWAGAFALCAIDSSGAVRTTSGDPQNGLSDWTAVPAVPGFTGEHGAAASIVADGTGVDLFTVDTAGAVFGTAGGVSVMTGFTASEHGWHFDNDFVNERLYDVIPLTGLCGGMAYSSLDYYHTGIPIPTHRSGDFPSGMTYPAEGRLHAMIHSRLADSFLDNFGKWSCIYPDLDAAIGAALGLVVGGTAGALEGLVGGPGGVLLGALGDGAIGLFLGAGGGWIFGELHEAFECPGGGASGMTRQELPHLITDFLDQGIPVPIGLIYDRHFLNIGESHQVVAYGYAVVGNQTRIYVYDNRIHDQECMLTIDTEKYGKFTETLTDGRALPGGNNGNWEGLLVEDGYQTQSPSYGQDIGIASPQALTLSGKPVIMVPATPDRRSRERASGAPAGPPERAVAIFIVAQQPEPPGQHLTDSFTVQNFGEYPAHYQSLGIEIDPPEGAPGNYPPTAAGTDNLLAPGQTMPMTVDVNPFGDAAGVYTVKAGYNSVPTPAAGGRSYWLTLFYPSASVTVT